MPIQVVCPGCKKRFSVSEKYAGQKGPCPACKAVIEIPNAPTEEVVVHGPEGISVKEAKGPADLKPIKRAETEFDPKVAGGIAGAVLAVFVVAWIVGSSYKPTTKGQAAEIPLVLKVVAALALGPPLAFAGYSFLRNDELEPYRGKELWVRLAACGVVYAALWGLYAYTPWAIGMESGFESMQLLYVLPPLLAIGALAAHLSLDLEFLTGAFHYGLYVIVTVLLRVTAQMAPF